MARRLLCLAALSGQPPGARRVAPEGAEGLTAKARAELQSCPAITLHTYFAFLILFPH